MLKDTCQLVFRVWQYYDLFNGSVYKKDTHLRSDENFIKNRKGKWIGPDLQLSHIKYRPFFKANFDLFVQEPALGMTENNLQLVKAHGFWFGIHNKNSDDVGEWVEHTWVISNFGWNFFMIVKIIQINGCMFLWVNVGSILRGQV